MLQCSHGTRQALRAMSSCAAAPAPRNNNCGSGRKASGSKRAPRRNRDHLRPCGRASTWRWEPRSSPDKTQPAPRNTSWLRLCGSADRSATHISNAHKRPCCRRESAGGSRGSNRWRLIVILAQQIHVARAHQRRLQPRRLWRAGTHVLQNVAERAVVVGRCARSPPADTTSPRWLRCHRRECDPVHPSPSAYSRP